MSERYCTSCFNEELIDYITCSQCGNKEYYCKKCIENIPYYKGHNFRDYFQFCTKCVDNKSCYLCHSKLNGYLEYFGIIKAENSIYQNINLIEEDICRKYSIEITDYDDKNIVICNKCDEKQQNFFSYNLYDVLTSYDQIFTTNTLKYISNILNLNLNWRELNPFILNLKV